MSDDRAVKLLERGDELFSARPRLMTLFQEIASMFYPERADFTVERLIGDTFADWLMTSYPLIARRDLGNAITAMLRPKSKHWFQLGTMRPEREDRQAKAWFDYARDVMRRAMYARASQFVRATKEGDHDFAAFGQCVLTAELNGKGDDLLYRNWHLRDVVWCEDNEGKIDEVHRKWKPYASDVVKMFPKTAGTKLKEIADKKPYEPVECRHIVLCRDDYEPPAGQRPPRQEYGYVSIYLNMADQEFLEEKPIYNPMYIIPRWQTVSGSQYAYSPATVAALPDARLIQAMTLTLLEAGERFTNPPMIAVQEAIRSDVQLYAGGITWVDAEYDERLGEVLRPLTQDKSGMPLGRDLRNDVKEALAEAFFLNKLNAPVSTEDKEMTAFETGQRVQEYIRQTLPLFEPLEADYNGGVCEVTFDLLMRAGAFGPHRDIPQSIRGQDIQFKFISPLSEAIEAQKAGNLTAAKQLIATVADLDPTVGTVLDAQKAVRDAMSGVGVPAKWLRSGQEVNLIKQYRARLAQATQALAAMKASAETVQAMGDAGSSLKEALAPPAEQQAGAAA